MSGRGPLTSPQNSSNNNTSSVNYRGDQKVEIKFAGSGLSQDLKLGPEPIVSITRDFIKDGAKSLIGINTRVSLNGYIYYRTPAEGWKSSLDNNIPEHNDQRDISILINKQEKLKSLLNLGRGDLEIWVQGSKSFEGKNAKVSSFNIEPTPNAWSQTIAYNVDFDFYEPLSKTDSRYEDYRVSNISESWSIEPLDNYVFTAFNLRAQKKVETEPASAGSSLGSNPLVYITGLPQFRVIRKISAVGVSKENFASHFDKNKSQEYNFITTENQGSNDAYLQAKKWVDKRLNLPFDTATNANSQFTTTISTDYSFTSFDKLFLYNHTRNINYSITEGSYEVVDNWYALPSGVTYIEDFTIESSTDGRYVKTVKIQGTVKGLQVSQASVTTNENNLLPNKTDGKLSLSEYNVTGQNVGNIKGEKYQNAEDAWIDRVKPFLYSRASLAVNSPDRDGPYYDPSYNGGRLPPGNPTIKLERLLNYIPISTSESHDVQKGIIGYAYEYDNNLKIFSGVISENVTIEINGPGDQIAEIFVLGRPMGPVLQTLGTRTSTRKSVAIELIVPPPTTSAGFNMKNSDCPVWTGGYIFQTCEKLIEGQKPYGQRLQPPYNNIQIGAAGNIYVSSDTYAWDASEGRYSRNIEWVYQPCGDGSLPTDPYYFVNKNP